MALASCPCCTKPPELQLTLVDRFCSSSEVLDSQPPSLGGGGGSEPLVVEVEVVVELG